VKFILVWPMNCSFPKISSKKSYEFQNLMQVATCVGDEQGYDLVPYNSYGIRVLGKLCILASGDFINESCTKPYIS
jgi:hypothetical protein